VVPRRRRAEHPREAGVSARFADLAAQLGVELEITHYPEGTRTAADAAHAIGCDVGAIVKSLVFVVNDVPVLALTSGTNRVDVERLGAIFDAPPARQATAAEVRDVTGFAIGGTPPFGVQLPTLFDADLLEHETVWAAAGTPDSVFPITPLRLVEVTGARVAEFTSPA
jgi:prolyl-tRNA editing enzyme YbaK/EbsC (Cys-tRNA(Pro) deacylase)